MTDCDLSNLAEGPVSSFVARGFTGGFKFKNVPTHRGCWGIYGHVLITILYD